MKYQLQEKTKLKFISLVLLNEIINFQTYFPVVAIGEDVFLTSHLQRLHLSGALTTKDGKYIPTDKGREELVLFYNKYYEYLKIFDIFCAVDLERGEFAFSSINEPWSDEEWFSFLDDERFSDVRVAVADFKGLNPLEIVFMSYLNENRFDCGANRWQYNLTGDEIWREIEAVCNNAISVDYLKEDGVLEDVIKQGTEIALQLIKEAEESLLDDEEEDVVEETIVTEEYVDIVELPRYEYSYWEPYYDPFYISPLWLVPAVLIF